MKYLRLLFLNLLCYVFGFHKNIKPYKFEVLGYMPRNLNGTSKDEYIIDVYKICDNCGYKNIKHDIFKTNKYIPDNKSVLKEYKKINNYD